MSAPNDPGSGLGELGVAAIMLVIAAIGAATLFAAGSITAGTMLTVALGILIALAVIVTSRPGWPYDRT